MTTETRTEYWRWTESRYTNPDVDWKRAKLVTAGIDVGSVSSQCVVVADGQIYAYSSIRTGSNSPESAKKAMEIALDTTGVTQDNLKYIVGTGYGRINIPMANRALTEIACHARGANYIYGPSIRTLLDMGGQDCKAIKVDPRGKVEAFLMNDKCAAGTGRGMEVFADLLAVPITEIGELSFKVEEEPPPVSTTCVVFAKSEARALLNAGWSKPKVLAAYCSAMAHRVVTLLERIGVEGEFGITGGISKNVGVTRRIEKELGVTALVPKIDAQIAGALGAALFAQALAQRAGA